MKLLVNTLSVSCVELPFIVQWPHHISSVNIIKLTKMDEHLWSHCYFIVPRSGTLWEGKNYRCRKIQIFTSQFADFAKYRFSFPFANCSKPFFLIQCLSQFLDVHKSFAFFSSSVNKNGLFLNYSKEWVLCIRNRFHAKQHCVVLKFINLIYSIYHGLSIVFFSQNWFVSYSW